MSNEAVWLIVSFAVMVVAVLATLYDLLMLVAREVPGGAARLLDVEAQSNRSAP